MTFLTLAELRGDTRQALDLVRALGRDAGQDGGHRLIWSLFGGDAGARRDFLYRTSPGRRFLIVSARMPAGDPAIWRLQSKPYAPAIVVGQRFGFSLRVNPSMSLSQPARGKSKRLDLFQYHKITSPGAIDPAEREALVLAWLERKLAGLGAALETEMSFLSGLQPIRLRGKERNGRSALLTAADTEGVLSVTAPEVLSAALTAGIGHGKAYGLGLLLLRPLGPPNDARV
ncbi:CRISPR system cascade subunit CasE [mine drainage metagenome]|uniref:CRISPR system cascade subunit CasE n=1 Tax=mine drainage metagenome TaxID=410659 RepID=A0A1J5R3Y6_9ZZZZ